MEIIKVKYVTPKNIEVEGYFIKTPFGLRPVFIELGDVVLDKSNKVISEESAGHIKAKALEEPNAD